MRLESRIDFINTFLLKKPHGWRVSLPQQDNGVCLLPEGKISLYEKLFDFGFRVPLSDFQIRVTNFFRVCLAQLLPNSWRLLVAFKALYLTLKVRPIPILFRRYYPVKGLSGWYFFTKELKALMKLSDGLVSSISASTCKKRF